MESLPHYDAWRTAEPPEEKPLATCAYCGCEIHEGESYWELDGQAYCSTDCLAEGVGARLKGAGEE